MSESTGLIHLPNITTEVQLASSWFSARDSLISEVSKLTSIVNIEDYRRGADYLAKLTKVSNKLESYRKEISEPFNNAAKLIKKTSDDARRPLENTKESLQSAMGEWQKKETRRQEEEAQKIEAEARKESERIAHERELEAQANADLGLDDAQVVPEPVMSVPVAPTPRSVAVCGVRMAETFAISIINEDKIPRTFLSVDMVKLRQYLNANKESVKARIKDEGAEFIPGVEIIIESKPVSTGR